MERIVKRGKKAIAGVLIPILSWIEDRPATVHALSGTASSYSSASAVLTQIPRRRNGFVTYLQNAAPGVLDECLKKALQGFLLAGGSFVLNEIRLHAGDIAHLISRWASR